MPFTPYHFGPHACIAFPLSKHIDIPVFILANVIVDLEALVALILIMKFGLNIPTHWYSHSFLIGTLVGVIWAIVAYSMRNLLSGVMKALRVKYQANFRKMLFSAILGVWLHILFDAPLYRDIKPFFPSNANPLYGILSQSTVYKICIISFIPAIVLYAFAVVSFYRNKRSKPN